MLLANHCDADSRPVIHPRLRCSTSATAWMAHGLSACLSVRPSGWLRAGGVFNIRRGHGRWQSMGKNKQNTIRELASGVMPRQGSCIHPLLAPLFLTHASHCYLRARSQVGRQARQPDS